MIRLALAMSLLTLPALVRAQCADWQSYTVDEARQMMSELVAPEGDPLEQLFAFEALMCSDQPVVRQIAMENAANAPSETVRSQLLLRALMDMTVLRMELGEGRPTEEKYAKSVQPPQAMLLDVEFRDPRAACLSFHQANAQKGCHSNSLATVSGLHMSMKISWSSFKLDGEFDYDYGDTMSGEVRFKNAIYPATIKLF